MFEVENETPVFYTFIKKCIENDWWRALYIYAMCHAHNAVQQFFRNILSVPSAFTSNSVCKELEQIPS